MQLQQSRIGDELNTLAQMREQHTTELQDAVQLYLPALYKGPVATWATRTTPKTRFRMLSYLLTGTSIKEWRSRRHRSNYGNIKPLRPALSPL